MKNEKLEAEASSKTLRKVVNKLSEKLKITPKHSKYPSQDFDLIVEDILPQYMKDKALEWYERGIKRGMTRATDLMLSGKVYKKDKSVIAPSKIKINVKTKFLGEDWESREVIIKAKDIGFDN